MIKVRYFRDGRGVLCIEIENEYYRVVAEANEFALAYETAKPTYCAGCSFKCQASDCDCTCHDKMREGSANRAAELKIKCLKCGNTCLSPTAHTKHLRIVKWISEAK